MEITTKKIYCGKCKKLVRVRDQRENEVTTILCNSCGTPFYSWDGISWKPLRG